MATFHYDNGRLHSDGVDLTQIGAEAGTPCYVYSRDRVLENWSAIRSAFSQAEIHYSLKANANLALVKLLIAAAAALDAVRLRGAFQPLIGCAAHAAPRSCGVAFHRAAR